MIITEFYDGQGLGNQIWCYLVTRCIALSKGYDFGIQSVSKFKGKEFLKLDFGEEVKGGFGPEGGPPVELPKDINNYYREKTTRHPNGLDISKTDFDLLNVQDGTKIDGNMQSLIYIENFRHLIKEWIVITKSYDYDLDENVCIIHVRGGDFKYSSAILGRDYYINAMRHMSNKNIHMKFFIVTDDITYSRTILPEIGIIGSILFGKDDNISPHHMGGPVWIDWSILSKSKNIILSASSFSFWPTYLNDDAFLIAPMYWGDYNRSNGYWSCGDMIVNGWNYLDREGNLHKSSMCLIFKQDYEQTNKILWE